MPAGPLVAIVDDDASAREALIALVRAMGFNAMGFASASAFLGAPERSSTACLLSDVRMPGMTGLDLHFSLAAAQRPVPTILVTAYPDDATRGHALAAGVIAYLAKPCSPDLLAHAIRGALASNDTSSQPESGT